MEGLKGKSSITGGFSVAMFDYYRVYKQTYVFFGCVHGVYSESSALLLDSPSNIFKLIVICCWQCLYSFVHKTSCWSKDQRPWGCSQQMSTVRESKPKQHGDFDQRNRPTAKQLSPAKMLILTMKERWLQGTATVIVFKQQKSMIDI